MQKSKALIAKCILFAVIFFGAQFVLSNPVAVDDYIPYTTLTPWHAFLAPIIIALVLTLIIESVAGFILGLRDKKSVLAVVGINLITNPLLNFAILVFPFLRWSVGLWGAIIEIEFILEAIVVIVEGCLLSFALKKPLPKMLLFSLIMNAVSFALGLALFGN
jgi:hypothetical protein